MTLLFEQSLANAVRFEPKLQDLPFNDDADLLLHSISALSKLCVENRLLDAINAERGRGNTLECIKLLSLYLHFKEIDVCFAANFIVDFDETIIFLGNERMNIVWLQVVHLYTFKFSLDYFIKGALLAVLLPKLLADCPVHRQLALRALSRLSDCAGKLKCLVLEYKEFLLDSLSQQLSQPALFPLAPRLLSSILFLLPIADAMAFLEPFVYRIEELLEDRSVSPRYMCDSIDCLQLAISLCRRSPKVHIPKAVVNELQGGQPSEDHQEASTLNESVATRIFDAAINFLSSDCELLRRRTCRLVEECTLFYETVNRDNYLSSIHRAWDRLSLRIVDDDLGVCKIACKALASLIDHDVKFVQSRISHDWLKRILKKKGREEIIIELLTRIVKARVELELKTVECMVEYSCQSPLFMQALQDSPLFSDIAWYHIHHRSLLAVEEK